MVEHRNIHVVEPGLNQGKALVEYRSRYPMEPCLNLCKALVKYLEYRSIGAMFKSGKALA